MERTDVAVPLYRVPEYLCDYAADDLRRAASLLDIRAISRASEYVERAMIALRDGAVVVGKAS